MQTLFDSFRGGPLPWVADQLKFMSPDVTDAFPLSLLTTEQGCASLLERYLSFHAEDAAHTDKRRARISMWSQWYFAYLLPTWVIVSLTHNWQLPIRPERLFLSLQQEGLPSQIYLRGEGTAFTPSVEAPLLRFEEMIEQHLRPVCQAMADLSGLKPSIYWGNAAVRVGWGIQQAELVKADVSEGKALLDARELSAGRKNPLFQPLRPENPHDPESPLFRRQCCLRHELPDIAMCPSCPLLLAEKRRRIPTA
ncbi:siderophore-iron reductase FhuF [Rouxiella silvae]|uniref:Siderophore-iron reductase FhuF n=1 Tax=Rouxiella silvae TaxID=1646373 RepID=A0AA40X3G2_9GAMM|nr:siderophore-iron reductase FhuF [Rouxiella silvae]MBF6637764.1 siderophore-iron reductase FhuF [Rouxiella silvae]ORJ20849.1 siderophore-iron reductase FhuF [Rouxiella silvae]